MFALIERKQFIPISKKSVYPIISSESVSYYTKNHKAWKACYDAYDKAARKIYNAKTSKGEWKYHKIRSEVSVLMCKITYYSTKKKSQFYYVKTFTVVDIGYYIDDKGLEDV